MSMPHLRALLALVAFCATSVLATGVIVPLYIYPASAPSCDAWSPLFTAISSNPTVPFFVIVNPASGPGGANTQPNSDYQGCVPKLKASNVKILGYVDTANGNRASSAVIQDIDTYAGWSSAYRPVGIFFDDVTPSSGLLSDYTTWTSSARQALNGGAGFVILNPGGSVGDTQYFSIADQIVTMENFYDDFTPSQLTINSNSPASKQAVILHDGPTTVPTSLVSQLVRTDGIGSLFITNDGGSNPYGSFPADWSSFVSTVASD
ncbi:hypothetical protein EIP86_001848 [Pleurotus ostreatoroseus]|nr:hypothetical protein EIP86_001848 [Pleurotus ostreatoroseus]